MKAPTSQSGRTLRSMPIAPPQAVLVVRKVAAVSSWMRWPPKLLAQTVIGAGSSRPAAAPWRRARLPPRAHRPSPSSSRSPGRRR